MYGAQIAFRNFSPIKGIWGQPVGSGSSTWLRFAESFSFWRHLRQHPRPEHLPPGGRVSHSNHAGTVAQLRAQRRLQEDRATRHLRAALHLHGGDRGHDPAVPGHPRRHRQRADRAGRDRGGQLHGRARLFQVDLRVGTEVWQETGWGAIIYLAALSAIDPELHEAAIVDGASRVQRIVHIDIPGIPHPPTVTILLILRFGRVLFVGFEKVLLMQNPLNLLPEYPAPGTAGVGPARRLQQPALHLGDRAAAVEGDRGGDRPVLRGQPLEHVLLRADLPEGPGTVSAGRSCCAPS